MPTRRLVAQTPQALAQRRQPFHLFSDIVVDFSPNEGRAHFLQRRECLSVQKGNAPKFASGPRFPAAVPNVRRESFDLTPGPLGCREVILEFSVALHGQNLEA
jgi:hypothetical protein